jgi:nitric oxide reductase NorQ protein
MKGKDKHPKTAVMDSADKAMVSISKDQQRSNQRQEYQMDLDLYDEIGTCFLVQKAIHSLLKRNVKQSINTLLLGPTGVGKTELVANIAEELQLPLTIFDMGTMTDPIISIVGTHVIEVKDGIATSTFKRSRFSSVIQSPGIVLLDEISRSSAAANNLLFPCLDFRRSLAMEYDFVNSESIAIHPDCVFIATANLGSQYTGTHKLDKALLDRFMSIEIDPLPAQAVKRITSVHFPGLKPAEVETIVDSFCAINKAHEEYKVSFSLSIRHLKLISKMVEDGFTIYDSFYMICKGLGNKDGADAISEMFDSIR